MGKFQLVLLLSIVTCAIISSVQSGPVTDASEAKDNAEKCKKLCGFCGCTGYYCGDECLCECNSQKDGEAECVGTMKSNCKKLELPFEVLIQGPNANRMVRSLLYADPNQEACAKSSESNVNKRSTISIYRPDSKEQHDEILSTPKFIGSSDVAKDDDPVKIVVAEKSDVNTKEDSTTYYASPMEMDDTFESHQQYDALSKVDSENSKLLAADDDIDRANIKRHIVDVNQDVAEIESMRDDDNSFLYKRDAEGDAEVKEETAAEDVGAAAPAAAAVVKSPMERVREAVEHIKIATSTEIRTAWEGVRADLNKRISVAIADAEKRAAALRTQLNPPPPPPPPAKPLFNPFLKTENTGDEVGSALFPFAPAAPAITTFPIAKHIATLRANNKLIQDTARAEVTELILNLNKNWLFPPAGVR